ncbi:MAG: C13 family peptidase [Gammaproteobacteria bacterium]|jgi:hypothetical protein
MRMLCLTLLGFAPIALAAETFVAVIGGLAGEERFEAGFRGAVSRIAERSRGLVLDDSNVRVLDGAESTREAMSALFDALAREARADDQVIVVLVGHGTHDGTEYKFNIPGPDVTGAELRDWLDAIPAKRQLVVLTTSASGGALSDLKKERRIVIVATKSGAERNATIFADYWVEALSFAAADTDKNGSIDAAEAFGYANEKVADYYASRDRLATEHARMEGEAANTFIVARLKPREVYEDDPKLAALVRKRAELEDAVERLRVRKSDMELEIYMRLLQDVLLELAVVEDEIERYESVRTGSADES